MKYLILMGFLVGCTCPATDVSYLEELYVCQQQLIECNKVLHAQGFTMDEE